MPAPCIREAKIINRNVEPEAVRLGARAGLAPAAGPASGVGVCVGVGGRCVGVRVVAWEGWCVCRPGLTYTHLTHLTHRTHHTHQAREKYGGCSWSG